MGADPVPTPGQSITIDLSLPANAFLNTAGGSKIVQSILVINTGTKFVAVSSICTHEACQVRYTASLAKIQCQCHGSEFSTTGSVIMGPATRALASYPITRTGDVLKITT